MTRRHDRIVTSGIAAPVAQLKGKRCKRFTSNTAIRTARGNLRFPDFGVNCGFLDDESMTAAGPALVVDILSPSAVSADSFDKLEEYKSIESIRYILLTDPEVAKVRLYFRNADRFWASKAIRGLEPSIEMPEIGVRLPLSEFYCFTAIGSGNPVMHPADPAMLVPDQG